MSRLIRLTKTLKLKVYIKEGITRINKNPVIISLQKKNVLQEK